ncbi:pepsin A-2/A-3 [Clonorchis sinensis]|uniref:Pepsin A-2/A-3 n=1 Tax=Clonorchis sinensis TaxID=79923 RepID=G7Y2F2_CLOSI|nr:pepsin A-2/A-3 [Clonorchis sinensis]
MLHEHLARSRFTFCTQSFVRNKPVVFLVGEAFSGTKALERQQQPDINGRIGNKLEPKWVTDSPNKIQGYRKKFYDIPHAVVELRQRPIYWIRLSSCRNHCCESFYPFNQPWNLRFSGEENIVHPNLKSGSGPLISNYKGIHPNFLLMRTIEGLMKDTFRDADEPFNQVYEDDACVGGVFGIDTLHVSFHNTLNRSRSRQIGGTKVTDVKFGQVLVGEELRTLTVADGFLGLGFDTFGSTVLDILFARRLILRLVFTVVYPRYSPFDGRITFGGIRQSDHQGNLRYAPVISGNFWNIGFRRMEINGHAIAEDFIGTMDTGTLMLVCPERVLRSLSRHLGVNLLRTQRVDCKMARRFPPIYFILDKFQLEFPPSFYIDRHFIMPRAECFLNFKALPHPDDTWIFGASFLRQFYTVFDKAEKRIGFATPW